MATSFLSFRDGWLFIKIFSQHFRQKYFKVCTSILKDVIISEHIVHNEVLVFYKLLCLAYMKQFKNNAEHIVSRLLNDMEWHFSWHISMVKTLLWKDLKTFDLPKVFLKDIKEFYFLVQFQCFLSKCFKLCHHDGVIVL